MLWTRGNVRPAKADLGCLVQGWRLDPILFFANTLIAGAAIAFSIETYQLRAKVADLERPDRGVCSHAI